jgi:transcriptional regulator with XRE-family HTH domain
MRSQEVLVDVGSYLRAQRELAQLSLRAMARLTNVSGSYLSQVERGLFQPSPEVLAALAEGLGIAPSTLFRKIGWLPDELPSGVASVPEAIKGDGRLDNQEKAALLAIYTSMVRGKRAGTTGPHTTAKEGST